MGESGSDVRRERCAGEAELDAAASDLVAAAVLSASFLCGAIRRQQGTEVRA
jgi:hypothetical protein